MDILLKVSKIKYEQSIQEKESMQKMEFSNLICFIILLIFAIHDNVQPANNPLLSTEYLESKKIEAMSVNIRSLFHNRRLTRILFVFPRSSFGLTSQICSSMRRKMGLIYQGNLHIKLAPIFLLVTLLCFRIFPGPERGEGSEQEKLISSINQSFLFVSTSTPQ